jgi:hypothetical protein
MNRPSGSTANEASTGSSADFGKLTRCAEARCIPGEYSGFA